MNLFDYIDQADLQLLLDSRLVSYRLHPEFPEFGILNYTHAAAGAWDSETLRKCRGLIYRNPPEGDPVIVAMPWEKFFNYGDNTNTGVLPTDVPVTVTNKADGSLGVLFHLPDGRKAVSTRGSFESDQAIHATAWLNDNFPLWDWYDEFTPLVEIIFPENRIVLNYGSKDTLVLLGCVHVNSGRYFSPEEAAHILNWPGEVTETFSATSLAEALALPPRENAEGIVVAFNGTRTMVKVKQEDYLRLHKVLYGLSNKAVWEMLLASPTLGVSLDPDVAELIPNEVLAWVDSVADAYRVAARDVIDQAIDFLHMFEFLKDSPDYFKSVALGSQKLDKKLQGAVLFMMRHEDLSYRECVRKVVYWNGYGAFSRPQNITNEEE